MPLIEAGYRWDDRAVMAVRASMHCRLALHLPGVLADLVLDTLIWTLREGSLLDALGVTSLRGWHVCVVTAFDGCLAQIRPVDRLDYPHVLPSPGTLPASEWIPLGCLRLAPYLSQVRRCEPSLASPGDLVDLREESVDVGRHAEVISTSSNNRNGGQMALVSKGLCVDMWRPAEVRWIERSGRDIVYWVLPVGEGLTIEARYDLGEWITQDDADRLAVYRSRSHPSAI
jgi:hypothetical protein